MSFKKSFDELLDQILTDYRNQFPEADTSQGSLIFIKSACMASALWGLYNYQDWISRQIFADTADSEHLEHHAWIRDIHRTYAESDSSLVERYLDDIRRPPTGGNQYDYMKWARSVDNVKDAYSFPLVQGIGSIDVVILANAATTGSEVPSHSARSGVVTSISAGKIIDSTATFNGAKPVQVGDRVRNTVKGTETVVTAVDSATQLSLQDDIFKYVGENYHVYYHSGYNTGVAAGKLIDSGALFNDSTYTVRPGDIVENIADGSATTIVAVDSAIQIALAGDIFLGTGKGYVIRGLIETVKEYIDDVRPVTASRVHVLPPTIMTQNVTMSMSGTASDRAAAAAEITAYLSAFEPDQVLYVSQLAAIGIRNGADNALVTTPAADVVPGTHQMIRPGVINVT